MIDVDDPNVTLGADDCPNCVLVEPPNTAVVEDDEGVPKGVVFEAVVDPNAANGVPNEVEALAVFAPNVVGLDTAGFPKTAFEAGNVDDDDAVAPNVVLVGKADRAPNTGGVVVESAGFDLIFPKALSFPPKEGPNADPKPGADAMPPPQLCNKIWEWCHKNIRNHF